MNLLSVCRLHPPAVLCRELSGFVSLYHSQFACLTRHWLHAKLCCHSSLKFSHHVCERRGACFMRHIHSASEPGALDLSITHCFSVLTCAVCAHHGFLTVYHKQVQVALAPSSHYAHIVCILCCFELWACMQDATTRRFSSNSIYIGNTLVSSILLALLLSNLVVFAWRVNRALLLDKAWSAVILPCPMCVGTLHGC